MGIQNFNGKNIYITGGSSGIGLETARQVTQMGANVILFARTAQTLASAIHDVSENRLKDTQNCSYMTMDVTDSKEVDMIISKAIQNFGIPDILINCAGRAYPHKFEDMSVENLNDTMQVNLFGMWNVISSVLPYMKKKGGYIVNVSSIAGLIGVFGYTDYCASKFAVIGFSEALRSELKQYDIFVSILCPPDTDTPGLQTENQTKPIETMALSESAKLMQPADVAKTLLKGLKKDKFIIIPGLDGKLIYFIRRLFPRLIELISDFTIKKAQRRKQA